MFVSTITVQAGETVLEYRDGKRTRALGPGRHRRRTRASYVRIDCRDRLGQTAPQEVLTSDGVSLKVTVAFVWAVADPVAFREVSLQPDATVYLAVQVALREALAGLDVDTVLSTGRRTVAETVTSAAAAAGSHLGIDVREVVLKDVILPGELRAAYAELVSTRQKGKAQLEAARAETAALRSLANGAKLLDEHPALAKLRLVQALPYGSSLKLELGE